MLTVALEPAQAVPLESLDLANADKIYKEMSLGQTAQGFIGDLQYYE